LSVKYPDFNHRYYENYKLTLYSVQAVFIGHGLSLNYRFMKSIELVLNEEKDIAVHGKGAMGLVLSYEYDNPGIVELKGKDGIMPDDHSIGGEVPCLIL